MDGGPTFSQRIIASVLGLSILISVGTVSLPQKANAGLPVIDVTNLVQNTVSAFADAAGKTKEFVLDTLAWQVIELARKSLVKSLVNWINSGFQGSPAFVTDLKHNLRGVGDAVVSRFFTELSNQDIATTPFQDRILDGARLAYYLSTSPESFYTKYPYTLNQVSEDDRAFLQGEFTKGGWNAWISSTLNPQNNPYAAEMALNRFITGEVEEATGNRLQEFSWNRGFMQWRGDCKTAPTTTTSNVELRTIGSGLSVDENGNATGNLSETKTVSLAQQDDCYDYAVKTPGSVIHEQLNKTLGSNIDKIVTADELNEIIGALMNQLMGQLLGSDGGGGLSGSSRPSSGGGVSPLDQATSPTQTNDVTKSLGERFEETLTEQRRNISDFNAGWTRLRDAAEGVRSRCPGTALTLGSESLTPDQIISRAGENLVAGANSLSALDAINAKMQTAKNAPGDQTAAYATIFDEYNGLVLPSPDAFALVSRESVDTGDGDPSSLYTQLTRLASSRSCSIDKE
ncbi:MAG: hypothetical protein AB199_00465 [Parcubacteria bacterium C7867-004]|nr:MAG: hypothetical protein AB199_00465 [Parcubacteria bacterium C7867-004]